MKITQYLYWEKPGEKEELAELIKSTESEMTCRKLIAERFDMSMIEAAQVLKLYKEKFVKNEETF
jgi:hypothetical protein